LWGEGSVVWLTDAGMQTTGLRGVRAVKSPPGRTTITHDVLTAWSAARAERRARPWASARELALDRERWAVPIRGERGYVQQLPDLLVWPESSDVPGAIIAESGGRRNDRQRMILEGWRDAINSGRYVAVRYDCTTASVASWISRMSKRIGLTGSVFRASVQTTATELSALSAASKVSHTGGIPPNDTSNR
jgi:hypothetical protein